MDPQVPSDSVKVNLFYDLNNKIQNNIFIEDFSID